MRRVQAPLVALGLAAALAGCASPGARPVDAGPAVDVSPAASLDAIGRIAPGGSLALPAGNPLGASLVHVVDEYAAASGRLCRRVALGEPDGPRRVVCRRASGHWTATRSLTRGDDAVAPALGAASDVSGPDVHVLADGETLWAFAERTTGRGENWERIARANAIDDPARVDAGRALELPPGLAAGR